MDGPLPAPKPEPENETMDATHDYMTAVYPDYSKGYQAHTTDGGTVTLPDRVYESQLDYDGSKIKVLERRGSLIDAVLRGDLYGLGTSGTGDPIVEIVEESR